MVFLGHPICQVTWKAKESLNSVYQISTACLIRHAIYFMLTGQEKRTRNAKYSGSYRTISTTLVRAHEENDR